MATVKSQYALGTKTTPQPAGSEVVSVVYSYTFASGEVATGNVVELGFLPAGCVPVRYALRNAALGTTVPADFGILDAAGTAVSTAAADGGAKWQSAVAMASAALTLSTGSAAAQGVVTAVAPTGTNRKVGVVLGTVSAGGTGVLEVQLDYKAAN